MNQSNKMSFQKTHFKAVGTTPPSRPPVGRHLLLLFLGNMNLSDRPTD